MSHRHFDNYKSFRLGEVVVHPYYQGKKIGEKLTVKVVNWLHEKDQEAVVSMVIGLMLEPCSLVV